MITALIIFGIELLILVVWFITANIWNKKMDKDNKEYKRNPIKITIKCDEDNSITEFYTTIEKLEYLYYCNKYPYLVKDEFKKRKTNMKNKKIEIKKALAMKNKKIEIKKALAESIFNLKEFDISGIKLFSDCDLNSFDCIDILDRNVLQLNSDGEFIIPKDGLYRIENTGYELDIIYGRVVRVSINK